MKAIRSGIVALCLALTAAAQTPLGSEFTYQGRLKRAGQPYTGSADVQFQLYDAATWGTLVAGPVVSGNVAVADGLFTTTVDFGAGAFTGDARWLEVAVRAPSGSGAYATLSPRQSLTVTPHAQYAASSGATGNADTVDDYHVNSVPAANRLLPLDGSARIPNSVLYTGHGAGFDADRLDGQHGAFYQDATNLTLGILPGPRLSGTYSNALTLSHASNSFTGNGAGLTNLNAANLASGIVADARLSTNVALLSGAQTFSGAKTFQMPASFTAMVPFTVTTTANITNLNADLHDGYHAGNATGQIPISNGAACTTLNADLLDGYHAGNSSGQVPVSNGTVNANLSSDKVDGNHVVGTNVYTATAGNYVVNTAWCKLYTTGTANVLRLENPAGGGYSMRYYYSIDFAVPVFGNLVPGSTVDIIGLNNTTLDVRIYCGAGWLTYMGCSGGNGWLRGHAIYTD